MKNKIYTYIGILCLTVLTGCAASVPSNEYTASADVVSLTPEYIHDDDRSKDTVYRDYIKGQIEKSISSIDGISYCSADLTIDDNNTVKAVKLDYTYEKDVYSGSSLSDLEESFEKYPATVEEEEYTYFYYCAPFIPQKQNNEAEYHYWIFIKTQVENEDSFRYNLEIEDDVARNTLSDKLKLYEYE